MTKPRKISDLMQPGDSGFAALVARGRRLQKLDALLHATLVPELAQQVRVAGLAGGVLKLVTPSAAIATRLRLDAADLARTLQQAGAGPIDRVETLIAPLPIDRTPPSRPRNLSAAARDALARMSTLGEREDDTQD